MFVVHFILGEYYLLLFFTKVNKSIESASSAQENSPHLQPKAKEEPRTTPPIGSVPSQNHPPSISLRPSEQEAEEELAILFLRLSTSLDAEPKVQAPPAGVISRTLRIQRSKIRSKPKVKSRADPS